MRTRLLMVLACLCVVLVARIALDVRAEGPAKPTKVSASSTTAALAALTTAQFGGLELPGHQPWPPAPEEPPKKVYLAQAINPKVAETWEKLGAPIAMKFPRETPLEDVLTYIKSATKEEDEKDEPGLMIYVDPIGLQEAEKTLTSPIQLELEGVPLSTSLGLLLKQLGMKFYVQKDGIVMITSESSDDAPVSPDAEILEQITWIRAELTDLHAAIHGPSGQDVNLEITLAEAIADLRQEIQELRKETTAQHRRVNADADAAGKK